MEISPQPFNSRISSSSAKRVSLHPLERALIGCALIHLIFLPWALGDVRLWTQYVSLGIAIVTFIIALIPRHYTDENSRNGSHHLSMWTRLLRFPLFWLGLLLICYIGIQGFNPAWRYFISTEAWWMQDVEHRTWLPHGTISPIEKGNPWRFMMIYTSAWLLICSLWVGITRRRSLQIILRGLVFSAVLLAALAYAQRLSGTSKVYWSVESNTQIWGSFLYRNHGGAWFALMVALCFGLAFWHYLKALRTFAKSSPAPLYGFLSLLMIVAVIGSYSRGSVISTLLFLLLFIITFSIRQISLPQYPQKNIITLFLLLTLGGFAFVGLQGLNAENTWNRMERLMNGKDNTLEFRGTAATATFDMWRASPWLGHGADSFEFIFPIYQQHYPEIFEHRVGRKKKARMKRYFWKDAHNDIAQTLAELGIIGSSFIVLGWLWGIGRFIRLRAYANPLSITLLLGMGCTVAHSWGEFVFQNPAILTTWAAFGIISLRWAELDPIVQSK